MDSAPIGRGLLLSAVGAGARFGEGFPRQLFTGMAISLLGIVLITVAGGTGDLALAGILALVPFSSATIDEVSAASAGSIIGAVYMGVGPTAPATGPDRRRDLPSRCGCCPMAARRIPKPQVSKCPLMR